MPQVHHSRTVAVWPAGLADAHSDPGGAGLVEPVQQREQFTWWQGHAAGRRDADVQVQENGAAQPRRAGGVVADRHAVVIGGDVHGLRVTARAGVPAVHPLVVPGAGRVVVPEVVGAYLAVPEPETRIRAGAKEKRNAERS